MKGSLARRRTRARGFTLIELMVVVVLISILAALAAPGLTAARSDRLAFSYARQASEMVHNARSRAAGRGAAQLVIFEKVGRGRLLVYEALDGTATGATPPGPNPVSSCRRPAQWASLGTALISPIVEGMNLDSGTGTVNVTEDITMTSQWEETVGTMKPVDAWALCFTPNGTTWLGTGSTGATAAANMQISESAWRRTVELVIERHRDGAVAGLRRRVVMAGSAAPRIFSE